MRGRLTRNGLPAGDPLAGALLYAAPPPFTADYRIEPSQRSARLISADGQAPAPPSSGPGQPAERDGVKRHRPGRQDQPPPGWRSWPCTESLPEFHMQSQ